MIPVTQTKVVVKNQKGEIVQHGNCYAAAIASILELPITEVPNVEVFFHIPLESANADYWCEVIQTFVTSKGYELCTDNRFKCFHPELLRGEENTDEWIDRMRFELEDQYYLVSGQSPRLNSHMVVFQNGKMVHDPHPTRDGLISISTFQAVSRIELPNDETSVASKAK